MIIDRNERKSWQELNLEREKAGLQPVRFEHNPKFTLLVSVSPKAKIYTRGTSVISPGSVM
jgi:hypothetical protein